MIHLENLIIHYKETFGRELKLCELNGIKRIVAYWESKPEYTDLRWLAYILATVYHEVDGTFKPIEEYGKGEGKPYGKKLKYSKKLYTEPNKLYFGRGLTQNTWYELYEKLSIKAKEQGHNWDFLNNPELLLELEPSIWATFYAMTTGLYTGKKLSDYFNSKVTDPKGARRIINSQDRAELIATYYNKFYHLLTT